MSQLKRVLLALLIAALLFGPGGRVFASDAEASACHEAIPDSRAAAEMATSPDVDHGALSASAAHDEHGTPTSYGADDFCCHGAACHVGLVAMTCEVFALGRGLERLDEPSRAIPARPGDLPFKPPRSA